MRSAFATAHSRLLLLVLVAFGLAGCIGGPGTSGTIWVRNESNAPIALRIEQSGERPQTRGIAPSSAEFCPATGFGVRSGSVVVTVSGPSTQGGANTYVVPSGSNAAEYVRVDPSGAVHFDEVPPTQPTGCRPLPETTPATASLQHVFYS
jgi:hypothetical protein